MLMVEDHIAITVQNTGRLPHTGVIRGLGASRGVHVGAVRVLRDIGDAREIQCGDVVVCTSSPARLVGSLQHAGALIVDSGGTLSNAATVARELGIPAVVATGDASRVLRDGQRVAVDGASGIVRVYGDEVSPAA